MCFVKQKTAYEMRISDWSSDVCSSDLCSCHCQHITFVRPQTSHQICGRVYLVHRASVALLPPICTMKSSSISEATSFPGTAATPARQEEASCRERVCQYV